MADDLKDTIRENAEGPAKAAGDAGSVEQHKLTDQIEADKYLTSKATVSPRAYGGPRIRLFFGWLRLGNGIALRHTGRDLVGRLGSLR